MNVTESRFKNRQLHMEDYLQMVSAEQKEYAEVFDYRKIAEKSSIITGYWTDNLLDLILRKDNLNKAYKRVKSNKGAGGTDGMQVDELLPYLKENQETLIWQIRNGRYKPNPVRRVEIPKETKGEYRKLGVPTVVDRVIQQAITQELMPIYEEQFSENRFGFRPQKGQHDALRQCQKNVNDGYVYVVDMDLEKFFDTVCQSKLIEVLSRTIKDGRVISLIHKYLNAGVLVKGMFERTEIAVLEEGMKYQQIGIPPEEAQFLETRKFQINEIARLFRIPPHMVGDLEKSSFSNIEQQSLEFVKYTLDPWVIRWEQALKKSLFLPEEKKEFFIKLNVDGLLRGDYQSRMNGYAIGRQNGWLSTNDIREMEDMNPLPEEEGGNLYLVNGAMTKLKDAGAFAKERTESTSEETEPQQPPDNRNRGGLR